MHYLIDSESRKKSRDSSICVRLVGKSKITMAKDASKTEK